MSVVDVETMRRSVCAAMYASVVVGDDDQNGGLWCSPSAKTSRPTSSACFAIVDRRADALGLARGVPGSGPA
jgi:hypothetical protein